MDPPRQEKRSGPLVTLPDDLIFMEILVRLPVKCLARCKCVTSDWRVCIEAGDFVRHHRNRSRASPPSMLVIPRKDGIKDQEEFSDGISFYSLRPGPAPDTFEDEAELMLEKAFPPEAEGITNVIYPMHCDGLVAIATGTDQVFLCNPTMKEFVALPLGTLDVDIHRMRPPSAAIGFDRWKNQYVIARYFYRRRCYNKSSGKLDYDIGHEVLTVEDNWSWKPTANPPHAIGDTRPVCTRDAFYWGCDGREDPRPSSLMRFSLLHRTFDLVPCPPHFAYNSSIEHLADLGGNLCYVNIATSKTTFDVWQLADDGTLPPHWVPRCHIIVPGHDISFGFHAFLPLLAAGGRMLTMVSDSNQRLYWCDEKSGDVQEVVDLEEDIDFEGWDDSNYCIHHIFPYRESLISIRNYRM